jgi:hypothetical protein
MIKLTDIDYVKGLQSNLRTSLDTPQGKEVMKFLEEACGWYQSVFDPTSKEMTLINDGKRQVVATIKTLLRLTPEEVVTWARNKER